MKVFLFESFESNLYPYSENFSKLFKSLILFLMIIFAIAPLHFLENIPLGLSSPYGRTTCCFICLLCFCSYSGLRLIQSLRAFRRSCTVGYALFGRVVLVAGVVLATLLVLVMRFVLVTNRNRASHISR